jgi:hypothetical protein
MLKGDGWPALLVLTPPCREYRKPSHGLTRILRFIIQNRMSHSTNKTAAA